MPAPLLRLERLPVGLHPLEKRRLVTAHVDSGHLAGQAFVPFGAASALTLRPKVLRFDVVTERQKVASAAIFTQQPADRAVF